MRLKSLEIKGFKSFADKTVLNFDEGITGVIGPNGCGKSNIIDSIRWVIGEHKISNLRSENLESLVFNGSKTRSASGLAEVSLTFENTKNLLPTEFNTVTVTRKYYKSGESEYRLNDVACRLKDIHNLFMDTGISTDSYAIIELGMVDDIIKDKENSRRKMIEQAAGITIYKTRKKEAKLKLDATEQDLARIEDLLFEIHNQLKSLENQAKKAEKYVEIKTEYRALSIELAKASLQGFNITYKNLNQQQQQEIDNRVALEAALATDDAALEQEKLVFVEKEKALQQIQQTYNQLQENARVQQADKNLSTQQLQYIAETKAKLNDFLTKAGGQLTGLQSSIAFTTLQITDEEAKVEELTLKVANLKVAVEAKRSIFDDKRSHIDALRKQNQALQLQRFDSEKKVAIADTSSQNLQRNIAQLIEEQKVRSTQLQAIEQDKKIKEAELSEKNITLTQLQAEQDSTKEKILATQNMMEGMRNTLANETRLLDARTNEYELLKSLVDSMEGYPESVKFLHNNSGWNKDAPLLSDIIFVQPEYRAAVENVLDQYLNYYVVNNLQEGLQAISLLADNKKGKANFFLLDKFTHSPTYTTPADTLAALDVIEIDEKYKLLAQQLLGNVFIANNDDALQATHSHTTYQTDNAQVILEKTGKLVKGKYAITGGSVGLFEGKKIGRAKNVEKLKAEIIVQNTVVNTIKQQIQTKHNEVINYNEQLKQNTLQQTQIDINNLTNTLFALQNKAENYTVQQTNSTTKIAELTNQLEQTQLAVADTKVALQNYNSQLHSLTNTLQIEEADYTNAEQAYNAAGTAYNESNINYTKQQSKLASLISELAFKNTQLADLEAQVQASTSQLKDSNQAHTDTMDKLANIEQILIKALQDKEAAEVELNQADQAYYNLRNDLQQKETKLKQLQKNKEIIDSLLSDIKDKLTDLKLQLSSIKERLLVEFKIELETIIEQPRETEEDIDSLKERSEKMKKRLENIGEVNPTAIEAYVEMKKRYEFILDQKNDLVTAKDSLMQTIQEVEATANQQFLETFNKTRENFQKVFKALFTDDDTADMILVNPDNLAETGIDIIAKPKGKRPSSIGQLSGGEKTLTATALLFSIYLIKPAPFCILDEVDAPLDDANVDKFTNMIKQFSENSQFIIVTHNKQTMSAVDVIYGVTMQEAGVSKLVPVDFRSLN